MSANVTWSIGLSLDTIIGATFGAIIAWITFTLTRKAERKNRLIESIYRPLLGQIGRFFEIIEDYQTFNRIELVELEHIRQDGMYFIIDENIRRMETQTYRKLNGYKNARDSASVKAYGIIMEEIKKALEHVKDPEKYTSGTWSVDYRAIVSSVVMGNEDLRDCLIRGESPIQVLKEKLPDITESDIITYVSGYRFERNLTDALVESALEKAKQDHLILDMRSKRESLLRNLQELIDALKTYV